VRLVEAGTYLITGGLGGLGRRMAHWLVRHGARRLVLTGLRALPDRATWGSLTDPAIRERVAVVQSLEAQGAEVSVVQADVCDRARMAAVVDEIGPSLRGVVHLAGLPETQTILETVFARDRRVMQPKVAGAWVLHQLLRERELDFLICFSSISAVWGSRGQPLYAAANHFLDALTAYRRNAGLPITTVSWGPWSEGGMVSAEGLQFLAKRGVAALDPGHATAMLGRVMGAGAAQRVVANVEWTAFRELLESRGRRPLLERLHGTEAGEKSAGASALRSALLAIPAEQRREKLLAHIQQEAGSVLGLSAERLPAPGRGFFEQGMDSLMALDLKNRLQTALGLSLRATVVFNHSTVNALTDFLLGELGQLPVEVAAAGTEVTLSEAELLEQFDRQLAATSGGDHSG
jgi:epothilone polyketide synthase E